MTKRRPRGDASPAEAESNMERAMMNRSHATTQMSLKASRKTRRKTRRPFAVSALTEAHVLDTIADLMCAQAVTS